MEKRLFWNVDTQKDFINPDGKLYIKDAERIKPNLKVLTDLAKHYEIKVVSTADCHENASKELSTNPDFINTFPKHCMRDSIGADFIEETEPIDCSYSIDWAETNLLPIQLDTIRNIVILKDKFDVFKGNRFTKDIIKILKKDFNTVYVYGVATNVCVNYAVLGLVKYGFQVIVIKDAIKELPNLPVEVIYETWKNQGVQFITTKELVETIVHEAYNI